MVRERAKEGDVYRATLLTRVEEADGGVTNTVAVVTPRGVTRTIAPTMVSSDCLPREMAYGYWMYAEI